MPLAFPLAGIANLPRLPDLDQAHHACRSRILESHCFPATEYPSEHNTGRLGRDPAGALITLSGLVSAVLLLGYRMQMIPHLSAPPGGRRKTRAPPPSVPSHRHLGRHEHHAAAI